MHYRPNRSENRLSVPSPLAVLLLLGLVAALDPALGFAADPRFAPPDANPFGLTLLPTHPQGDLGDLDADGDLDLIVGINNGSHQLLWNTGSATVPAFQAPVVIHPPASPFTSAVALADLDADGDLDMVDGRQDGAISWFRNSGNSSTPAFASTSSFLGYVHPGIFPHPSGHAGNAMPADVDIDGDGDIDLIAGSNEGFFELFRNTGNSTNPSFSNHHLSPFGIANRAVNSSNYSFLEMGDIDGDGDIDALTGAFLAVPFRFHRNIGNNTNPQFAPYETNPFGLVTNINETTSFMMADLDADGDQDLLVGEKPGGFRYYQNTATNVPGLVFSFGTDHLRTDSDVIAFDVTFSESVGNSFTSPDVTVLGSLPVASAHVVPGDNPLEYTIYLRPSDPDADGTLSVQITGSITDTYGEHPAVSPFSPTVTVEHVRGDVNRDGALDLADVALLADANLGLVPLP